MLDSLVYFSHLVAWMQSFWSTVFSSLGIAFVSISHITFMYDYSSSYTDIDSVVTASGILCSSNNSCVYWSDHWRLVLIAWVAWPLIYFVYCCWYINKMMAAYWSLLCHVQICCVLHYYFIVLLLSPFWDITMVLKHNLGSACAFKTLCHLKVKILLT